MVADWRERLLVGGRTIALSLTAAVAALAASSSCQTMPRNEQADGPGLEFTLLGQVEQAREGEPAIAATSAESFEVTGAIATPNPCYTVAASLAADGPTLRLTLSAKATGGICIQMLAMFGYKATITGLSPGSYTVVTAYEYPDAGWEPSRHRLQVSLP